MNLVCGFERHVSLTPVTGLIAFILPLLVTDAGFIFIPEVSIIWVPFFKFLSSRIYELNKT